MKTILFAPATFNLAETTRMIEIAKVLRHDYHCVFCGFSETYLELIKEEKFEVTLLNPILTSAQEAAIIKFDQGKSLKNPFTTELVTERVASELALIEKLAPRDWQQCDDLFICPHRTYSFSLCQTRCDVATAFQ